MSLSPTEANTVRPWQARQQFARVAILAITRHGAQTAQRAQQVLEGATLYVPSKYRDAVPDAANLVAYDTATREQLTALFGACEAIVAVVSLGALVRMIAPLLADKAHDPAVVVIDDTGRFVIPVLAGHLGGANLLAQTLATALGATAVLTTASDSQQSLAVDLLGAELGWRIEANKAALVAAAAAVVNGEAVALFWGADRDVDWWQHHAGGRAGVQLPANLRVVTSLADPALAEAAALLAVTRTPLPQALGARYRDRLVLYRPPERIDRTQLAVGIGCDRGTPLATLEAALDAALARLAVRRDAIRHLASITLKRDEAAIHELARRLGVPLSFYPAEALAAIPVPNPSEMVRRYTGTPSVAEAAALLAAGWMPSRLAEYAGFPMLAVEKERVQGSDGKNATVALAYGYLSPHASSLPDSPAMAPVRS